jgi:hypothetical protein
LETSARCEAVASASSCTALVEIAEQAGVSIFLTSEM